MTSDTDTDPAPHASLRDLADDLYDAGHAFWQACRKEAGGGAIRWADFSDGTLIVFTRGEYRDAMLRQVEKDYSAPVVVFEDAGTEGVPALSAKAAPAPVPASASAPVAAWVPDGYELVAVRNFNDLMLALDRADRKGYMPDAMAGEWEAFQYITKERAQETGIKEGDTK